VQHVNSTIASYQEGQGTAQARLESIGHSRELLEKHRVNQLPIIKDDGRLAGLVTDRDLRTKEYVPQSSYEIPLELVMSRDVITLEPHCTLIDAALVMRRKRIGSVPIVDGGRLVGILTRSDILEAFISEERARAGDTPSPVPKL
jgi:CBS domain-containing protein